MYPVSVGIKSAAKIARITRTTISSTRVNPFFLLSLSFLFLNSNNYANISHTLLSKNICYWFVLYQRFGAAFIPEIIDCGDARHTLYDVHLTARMPIAFLTFLQELLSCICPNCSCHRILSHQTMPKLDYLRICYNQICAVSVTV